jgi:hypothetical protein
MRSRLHALGSAVILQAMLHGLGASAAPVLQSDPNPLSARSDLAAEVATVDDAADSAPALDRQHSLRATGERASRALGGVPATEIDSTRAEPIASSTEAGDDGARGIDPDLKEAARAAMQWVHEARQLLLPAEPDATIDGRGYDAGWAGELPSRNSGGGAEYRPPLQQAHSSGRRNGGELDLTREAIELVNEIAGHPITWLLMLLLAFGGAAVLTLKYRSHVDRRWFRRRSGHRRHSSAHRSRTRHREHGAGYEKPAQPTHRSVKASARSRTRRSSKSHRTA